MVGPSAAGCNCHCIPIDPNCLGCDGGGTPVALPTSWLMDFPVAMSYGSARTGTVTVAEYNATGYPYGVIGGTEEFKRYFYAEWDWPDLSAFGISTSLVIDDATYAGASYGAKIDCIWANATFLQYRTLTTNVIAGPRIGYPEAWQSLPCSKGADNSNASPWYYKSLVGTAIPPGLSPNRTRNNISAADALCNTTVRQTDSYDWQYNCNVRAYGCFAILTVVNTGTIYDIIVTIYWIPRIYRVINHKRYFQQTAPPLTFWKDTITWVGSCRWGWTATDAVYLLDGKNTKATVYPSATDGLGQGAILIYKKSFNCAAEYNATPVTLPLFTEVKTGGATQSIVDAIGFVNVPSSITVTRVL